MLWFNFDIFIKPFIQQRLTLADRCHFDSNVFGPTPTPTPIPIPSLFALFFQQCTYLDRTQPSQNYWVIKRRVHIATLKGAPPLFRLDTSHALTRRRIIRRRAAVAVKVAVRGHGAALLVKGEPHPATVAGGDATAPAPTQRDRHHAVHIRQQNGHLLN